MSGFDYDETMKLVEKAIVLQSELDSLKSTNVKLRSEIEDLAILGLPRKGELDELQVEIMLLKSTNAKLVECVKRLNDTLCYRGSTGEFEFYDDEVEGLLAEIKGSGK